MVAIHTDINARVPPSSCVFTEILGIGHEPIEYINYNIVYKANLIIELSRMLSQASYSMTVPTP